MTTWSAPEAPGLEVTAVRDRHGVRWHRDASLLCGATSATATTTTARGQRSSAVAR
jgi:hypothetical protein